MPKAIKKRIAKPEKTEKNVTDFLQTTKNFITGRRKIFFPLILALFIIAFALAGFSIYRSNLKSKAETLEYEGYKTYYGLYQKQPAQKEDLYQRALEKFKKAYDTKRSPFSLFYIASCYYDMGKYDEALKNLKDLNERFPDDERFVPLSYYKMAVISAKKGDKDAALKLLDTIYLYKTGSFKELALIESARILESMGKTAESTKKYEEITKNYPGSPFIEEAREKLGGNKGIPKKS